MKEHSTPATQVQQTPLAPSRESKRALAIGYAELGLPVFPLVPNGKTPALAGDWKARATTDPERVADLRTCPVTDAELDYNIGIATGRSFGRGFLLVVDVDTRDGKQGDKSLALLEAIYGDLPATFTVRTTSGGRHFYFLSRAPVRNSVSKVGKHVDIKGLNGYVVGPGSTIDGKIYGLENAVPIAAAPEWLIQLTGAPRERVAATGEPLVDLDSQTAIARAIDWLTSNAPEAIEGANGDATTIKVANRVGDFGISAGTALDLLLASPPPRPSSMPWRWTPKRRRTVRG
ncbi:bifunctional DNA primase/polymerase [Afipia sp. Root123D2]|uniref:bifunctional DNA primase/polymerase n=1 Tax=Afipia sp. Root123D2 TaxID=1736436 RepID=UPI000B109F02|nr:bifunctional DNA primase/polymerase [Afipia sp. Root123D2]